MTILNNSHTLPGQYINGPMLAGALMAFAIGQIVTLAEDNSKWIILRLLSDELVILQNVHNVMST